VEKPKLDSKLYESEYTYDDVINMANELAKGNKEHDYKVILYSSC